MTTNPSLTLARVVADAVLYEGYLLYPYRASSQKNQSRWQFGILGPPGAAAAGVGEEPDMYCDALVRPGQNATVQIHLRFLQLQSRTAEVATADGFAAVDTLTVGTASWLSWDEAVEREVTFGPFTVVELKRGQRLPVLIPAGEDTEVLPDAAGRAAGRLVRRRHELNAVVSLAATAVSSDVIESDASAARGPGAGPPLLRIRVTAENTAGHTATDAPRGPQEAIAVSFIGAHLLLTVADGDFLSVLEPPPDAQPAAEVCVAHRCWPVLAGPVGQSDVLLLSPIILYDHPAVAEESSVALFDATEIDEILTLRVLTLTEEEKAEARATDPRAAALIDSCEAMTPEQLGALHGIMRNPHGGIPAGGVPDADTPWWNPEAEASVQPDMDAVMIGGIPVARGSRVRVNPQRRADAQDLFFAGRTARVTSVHFDVDGSTHVGLVLEEDPAADLHDWYGRSFYFAPDELVPLEPGQEAE